MCKTLLTAIFFAITAAAHAQQHREVLTREIAFGNTGNNHSLIVANVSGFVKVTGYGGAVVQVEAEKIITAGSDERLAEGREAIAVGVVDRADTIILYVDGLCATFGRKGSGSNAWEYRWNNCREDNWRKNERYDYRINFTVRVPAGVNLRLSTINNGDVEVSDVAGEVLVSNVNGSIRLNGIKGHTEANTVNGDLAVDYAANPLTDCRYRTLNGTIRANFQPGLATAFSFESFNGALYTNIEPLESLPAVVEKEAAGSGIKYRLRSNRFKIRNGGAWLAFETFNGDVYLKEGDKR